MSINKFKEDKLKKNAEGLNYYSGDKIKDLVPDEVPEEVKKAFPNAKVLPGNGYAQIQPQAPSSSMTMKDFLIVLQSCCNRDSTMTADQKLKFILDNYKAGLVATHKRLSESSDSF